jgi:hypothetical protein
MPEFDPPGAAGSLRKVHDRLTDRARDRGSTFVLRGSVRWTILADASTDWEGTGDLGLTLGTGVTCSSMPAQLGITRVAQDVNPFLGLAAFLACPVQNTSHANRYSVLLADASGRSCRSLSSTH